MAAKIKKKKDKDYTLEIKWDAEADKALGKWEDDRIYSVEQALRRVERGLKRAKMSVEFWSAEKKFLEEEKERMSWELKRLKKMRT
jgi:phage shock protein A